MPFLLLAFAVLFPYPDQTSHLFAWDIKPSMSAMVLGSVYLGGAYFFVRMTYARRWHEVSGGFVPVAMFAALMAVATILHWDRFRHGTAAFGVWTALYFTTPVIVAVTFLVNRRVDGASETRSPATAARSHVHRCGCVPVVAYEWGALPVPRPARDRLAVASDGADGAHARRRSSPWASPDSAWCETAAGPRRGFWSKSPWSCWR